MCFLELVVLVLPVGSHGRTLGLVWHVRRVHSRMLCHPIAHIREVEVLFAADNRHGNPFDENSVDYACLEFVCLPTERSNS